MFMLAERERLQVAAELKDNIGQTLLLARIKVGMLSGPLKPGESESLLEELRPLLDLAICEVRSLSHRLYPPLLAEAGLEPALKWLSKELETDYGLQVEFADDGQDKPLSDVLRSVVCQAARELLINVVRHAKSGAARLCVGREGDMLFLTVEDLDVGFDVASMTSNERNGKSKDGGNFGLEYIRRRIKSFGGELTLLSTPVNGTSVTVRVPISYE